MSVAILSSLQKRVGKFNPKKLFERDMDFKGLFSSTVFFMKLFMDVIISPHKLECLSLTITTTLA